MSDHCVVNTLWAIVSVIIQRLQRFIKIKNLRMLIKKLPEKRTPRGGTRKDEDILSHFATIFTCQRVKFHKFA